MYCESLETRLDAFEAAVQRLLDAERLVLAQLRSLSVTPSADNNGTQQQQYQQLQQQSSIMANLSSLHADFCIAALQEAIARYGTPEIMNSDQGSQFTSLEVTETLKANNIAISQACNRTIDLVKKWYTR